MSFDPAKDIPDLSDKVFFITGGTNGLGKQTILDLATHSPQHVYFTGRSTTGAANVIAAAKLVAPALKVTFIECDQQSLTSVVSAARKFLSLSSRLDVLICNAGVMATTPALTPEGYEYQFGVNHVAHALWIKLLLPTILKTQELTDDARIVLLTSNGFNFTFPEGIQFGNLKTTQEYDPTSKWLRYGQSKLANALYASELARHYPNITSVSLHPGSVMTDIIGRLDDEDQSLIRQMGNVIVEPEVGAYTTCWCATTEKTNLMNGETYEPVGKPMSHSKHSADKELAGTLWAWTQKELEIYVM